MRRYRVAGEASSSEADGERFQTSQREALAVLRTGRGQRELREPLHERVDGDLALHARERGAEAEVDAPAEGNVAAFGRRGVAGGRGGGRQRYFGGGAPGRPSPPAPCGPGGGPPRRPRPGG